MCINLASQTGVFIQELQENRRERAGHSLAYPGIENPMGLSLTCFVCTGTAAEVEAEEAGLQQKCGRSQLAHVF
jgi:hypothetical protein